MQTHSTLKESHEAMGKEMSAAYEHGLSLAEYMKGQSADRLITAAGRAAEWFAQLSDDSDPFVSFALIEQLRAALEDFPLPPLPDGPCPDGIYRADSGEIIRIHHGRHEPTF